MSDQQIPAVQASDSGVRRQGFRGVLASKRGRLAALGGAVFLVLVVALVAVLLAGQGAKQQSGRSRTQSATAAKVPASTVTYKQMTDEELTNEVNNLRGSQQYAEAEKLISMQRDLATNPAKLGLLTSVQSEQGKTAEAAQTAEKLAALGNLGPGQYESLGYQYEQAGNKAKAIEYYTKAIDGYSAVKRGSNPASAKRLQAKVEALR